MKKRNLSSVLLDSFKRYPVLTITGPRQSGKTTLVRGLFHDLPYVNLESPEIREYAANDPKGFLERYREGAVIDEIQNVPQLPSWIQVYVDEVRRNGLFVLTGSRQFEIMEAVSQSLAGRTGIFRLLPFSISELGTDWMPSSLEEFIYNGFFPRFYKEGIEPHQGFSDYVATYIERDVRNLKSIHNLSLFQKFVGLCAGRVGQILNLSSLANDAGISHSTASDWITILQASYTIHLLRPYSANINKRLIKSPKLYFYDTGLAAYFLGIENPSHVENHPLRGNLFENMVVTEAIKHRFNQGKPDNLYYFRDARGNEVDIIYTVANKVLPIEIKAGQTWSRSYHRGLDYFVKTIGMENTISGGAIVYAGDMGHSFHGTEILNFKSMANFLSENDG